MGRTCIGVAVTILLACGGSSGGGDADVGTSEGGSATAGTEVGTTATASSGASATSTGTTDATGTGTTLATTTVDATGDTEPGGEPGLRFVGRIDDGDPLRPRWGWSGAGVVFRFDGTGASIVLDDQAQFHTVVIDGEVQAPLSTTPGEQSYVLATGLPAGEHTIEVYRRTEGSFGPTVFVAVELEGELLVPPPATRRIEVVGDSITCGYGNLGADQYCGFSADTEDHYQTYGAMAARALGAEVSTVAWSGKGVVNNYDTDTWEPMPELYDRVIATEAAPLWDASAQVDAVVVNLGTNDFSTDGDPTPQQFIDAYVALLERMRAHYPSAVVLCTVAPILGGEDLAVAQAAIQAAVQARNDAGDADVAFIDLIVPAEGWGCDWHPSVATNQAMADLLVLELQAALGW
jgi:lysophospholipase L1-like esterase